MAKKNNVDKSESARSSEDVESNDTIDSSDIAIAEVNESAEEIEAIGTAGGIDITKIIKSTGGIRTAVKTAVPMIDQIASQARLEAQRASAMAMKAYRRQLQGIMVSMQGTIREEGVRLAEEICARVTTQIRQAVLLETEKKALNLVDEFILGWQIEAESISQDLLTSEPEPETGVQSTDEVDETQAVTPEPEAKHEVMTPDKSIKPLEAGEKDKVLPAATTASAPVSGLVSKKQVESAASDRPQSDTEKKVVFDFATFIAQSKSPTKT